MTMTLTLTCNENHNSFAVHNPDLPPTFFNEKEFILRYVLSRLDELSRPKKNKKKFIVISPVDIEFVSVV